MIDLSGRGLSSAEGWGCLTWGLVGQRGQAGLSSEGTGEPWRVACGEEA